MVSKEEYVNINTTFTGEHAKLINSLEQKFKCTKPTALRLFLNQFIAGAIVPLNENIKIRIENIISNPLFQKQFGINNLSTFIDFAMNFTLNSFQNSLKDLRDPAVQLMLDEEEIAIARIIVISTEGTKHYGGLTLEEIINYTSLSKNLVRRILKDFILNGWIVETLGRKYLPSKFVNLHDSSVNTV